MKRVLNETQLHNIVKNTVKKVLKEIWEPYSDNDSANGMDMTENPPVSQDGIYGPAYFKKNGVQRCGFNGEGKASAWLLTSFLGAKRVTNSIGARWATGSKKEFFDHFSIDSNAALWVYKDRKGNYYQLQISEKGLLMAADVNDNVIEDTSEFDWFVNHAKTWIRLGPILQNIRNMRMKEDEYFNSKSKQTTR